MRASALVFPAIMALSCAAALPAAGAQQKSLTVEEIFAHGPLIGTLPEQLSWAPNGKDLTYIDGGEMIEVDAATGKSHVLISREKLAPLTRVGSSVRVQAHRRRYHMASYFWAPDSKHIMFNSDGQLWIYNLDNGTGIQVATTGSDYGDDPKFSPDGSMISYIRDRSLTVMRLRDRGTPATTVAPSGKPWILNGRVDWVYREELGTQSNYFWSPNSKELAFLQMDEAAVPMYPIEDLLPTHATLFMQHYPQPGDANPEVHLGVVSAKGSRIIWMRLPIDEGNDYIPRFGWVNSKTLWIETLTRDQKHRDLYFANADTGEARKVLEISDEKFLDDNYDVSIGDGYIVLTDWSSGHNQLYLYTYDVRHPLSAPAQLKRQLTNGDFDVGEVYNVDDEAKVVDYASNEGNPLDQQLWEVGFDGQRRPLSAGAGSHSGYFAAAGGAYVDKYSTRMDPPSFSLCRDLNVCHVFWQTKALDPYHLHPPVQLEVKAHDGTILYATLLLPEGAKTRASVPLIVNPYGGPGEQGVANRWSDSLLFDELLAQHGFAVLHADNRGMAGRSRAFAQFAYHDFGKVQFQDQLTVLDAVLKRYPELDPKRLGWWGWSWGGTFTLYAMSHSDRFLAGVAVAPVTDWRDYDSIYTERYLGPPSQFPALYREFSPVYSAANLKGHLLLVHGTGDDNVHFANTVQFIEALIKAGIPYNLEIFPRETHSITGAVPQTQLYASILAYFERYLLTPLGDQ